MGDFNFGDIDWDNNSTGSNGKSFLKEVASLSLKQCVKNPTREKNILDLVLVYDGQLVSKITHLAPIAKSDHGTLKIELNIGEYSSIQIPKTAFNYDKATYKELESRINKN